MSDNTGWKRPALRELHERISGDFSAQMLDGGTLLSRSVLSVLARTWAGACHLMHGFLAWIYDQALPDTATEDQLLRWSTIWGLSRKSAVASTGMATGTGVSGAVIPAGTLARSTRTGATYTSDADATIVSGAVSVSWTAATAGADGDLEAGETLSLISPVEGCASQFVVASAGISGGLDAETDSALRSRMLTTIRNPAQGGCAADYATWALEVDGITRAFVYPLYLGIGTVGVCVLADDLAENAPFPTDAILASTRSHIALLAPVTACVDVFAPEASPVTLTVRIVPDTTTLRASVQTELADYWRENAEPGGTLYISKLREVIAGVTGLTDYDVVSPSTAITTEKGYYPVLTVAWSA